MPDKLTIVWDKSPKQGLMKSCTNCGCTMILLLLIAVTITTVVLMIPKQ